MEEVMNDATEAKSADHAATLHYSPHDFAELCVDNGEGGAQIEVHDKNLRESLVLNIEAQCKRRDSAHTALSRDSGEAVKLANDPRRFRLSADFQEGNDWRSEVCAMLLALSASEARLRATLERLEAITRDCDPSIHAIIAEVLHLSPTATPAEGQHGLDITREKGGVGLFESGGLYDTSGKAPADGSEE